jgi:hypothetical protein
MLFLIVTGISVSAYGFLKELDKEGLSKWTDKVKESDKQYYIMDTAGVESAKQKARPGTNKVRQSKKQETRAVTDKNKRSAKQMFKSFAYSGIPDLSSAKQQASSVTNRRKRSKKQIGKIVTDKVRTDARQQARPEVDGDLRSAIRELR